MTVYRDPAARREYQRRYNLKIRAELRALREQAAIKASQDLFGEVLAPRQEREEEHFGKMDARTGCPLRNYYSERITPARFVVYERGYRAAMETLSRSEDVARRDLDPQPPKHR